jgi:hypothetical protein
MQSRWASYNKPITNENFVKQKITKHNKGKEIKTNKKEKENSDFLPGGKYERMVF